MHDLELYLVIASLLVLFSVISSKISDRFGVPTLLIFLALGMLAGSDGILGIYFDDAALAQTIGILALIFILYAGGIDTNYNDIKPVFRDGVLLSTVGVLLTALAMGLFAHYIFDYEIIDALLIGAIISSTDAAAVFAILRAKGISLKNRLGPLLELESGSNDPMAIFLTITILQMMLLHNMPSLLDFVKEFFTQFIVGALFGYIFGIAMPAILNRVRFGYYGLYLVFSLAWVMLLFGLSSLFGGNGFLAVYLAGIFTNTKDFVHKKNIVSFHDGIAWVMQIVVFLTLGLLVFPSQLPSVWIEGVVLGLCLIFLARPIGVFLTLIFSSFSIKEKLFISWVGLRGAVPIILATYPMLKGIEHSSLIFNTVFIIVLVSLIVQGMSISFVAKLLDVYKPQSKPKTVNNSSIATKGHIREIVVQKDAFAVDKSLSILGIPSSFLVLLIKRGENYIKPTGSTPFEEGDVLLVYCKDSLLFEEAKKLFS